MFTLFNTAISNVLTNKLYTALYKIVCTVLYNTLYTILYTDVQVAGWEKISLLPSKHCTEHFTVQCSALYTVL